MLEWIFLRVTRDSLASKGYLLLKSLIISPNILQQQKHFIPVLKLSIQFYKDIKSIFRTCMILLFVYLICFTFCLCYLSDSNVFSSPSSSSISRILWLAFGVVLICDLELIKFILRLF